MIPTGVDVGPSSAAIIAPPSPRADGQECSRNQSRFLGNSDRVADSSLSRHDGKEA